jgi:hypothetical protein
MHEDIPNYLVTRYGRALWRPTPLIRRCGFQDQDLGDDGPEARAMAERWNDRWLAVQSQPSMLKCLRPAPKFELMKDHENG